MAVLCWPRVLNCVEKFPGNRKHLIHEVHGSRKHDTRKVHVLEFPKSEGG